MAGLSYHICGKPSSQHQHCTDEAQRAETVLSAVIYMYMYVYISIYCGRARARPQTNLAFGGQRHFLKAYSARADLKQNVGTFLAFLCSSNWNEWYVNKRRSKGPGVEFKLRDMGHVFQM